MNLLEYRNEKLERHNGVFQMVRSMLVGEKLKLELDCLKFLKLVLIVLMEVITLMILFSQEIFDN